ncbi:hypothetical protein AOY65_04830 [Escherichia coli]|nr:hypothetical protein [Escherichia coli]UMS93885.1 hypothetical protein AOY65_04830 [Escherichia coli]
MQTRSERSDHAGRGESRGRCQYGAGYGEAGSPGGGDKVPEGTEGKEGLQTRLDGLTPADVPAVTDQDGNGKADAAEASLAAAEAAVQAAEAKKEAADEAAANADKDQNGLITPARRKPWKMPIRRWIRRSSSPGGGEQGTGRYGR